MIKIANTGLNLLFTFIFISVWQSSWAQKASVYYKGCSNCCKSILRGFERVHPLSGETKKFKFIIKPSTVEKLNINMNWITEPRTYQMMLGSSSEYIR